MSRRASSVPGCPTSPITSAHASLRAARTSSTKRMLYAPSDRAPAAVSRTTRTNSGYAGTVSRTVPSWFESSMGIVTIVGNHEVSSCTPSTQTDRR